MIEKTEDLERQLAAAPDVMSQVDILNTLAWKLRYTNDPAHTLQLGKQALELIEQNDLSKPDWQYQNARSLKNIGFAYKELDQYDLALEAYTQALSLYKSLNDQESVAQVLDHIGLLYAQIGNYPQALNHFLGGLDVGHELGRKDIEAECLNNIGFAYVLLNENANALPYLTQCLGLYQELNQLRGQVWVCGSLCDAYYHLGDYVQALDYGMRSIQLSLEVSDRRSQTESLVSVGRIFVQKGDYPQALEYFQQALKIDQTEGFKPETSNALRHIGDVYYRLSRADEALPYLQQAHATALQINSRYLLMASCQSLADAFELAGDFKLALEYHKQFHEINESIFNEQTDLKLKTLDVTHRVETARREAEIYYLRNVELQREIEERQKIQAALQEMATTDPLTGILNRRHFYALAEHAVERMQHHNRPLSVIMLDIDHFKRVNDTYGHAVGDQALIKIASLLQKNMRQADLVARYGGEEFVILLPETNLAQAIRIAERLRKQVPKLGIDVRYPQLILTVSLGIADDGGQQAPSLSDLLGWADQALYKAKQSGRNRISVYEHILDYRTISSEPDDLAH